MLPFRAARKYEIFDKITLSAQEQKICNILLDVNKKSGLNATLRIAGGWVRDRLLGMDSMDIDIALEGEFPPGSGHAITGVVFAEQIDKYGGEDCRGSGVVSRNPEASKHLETAIRKVCDISIDFTNLRAEEYTDTSRNPNVRVGTLIEDAERRDLCMNALYYNLHTNAVEDPTHRGVADLSNGIVRTPLPPLSTFCDDPLRLLRTVRFACRFGFAVDPAIVVAARQRGLADAFAQKIVRERVWVEVAKMFGCISAGRAVVLMAHLGLRDLVFLCDLVTTGKEGRRVGASMTALDWYGAHDSSVNWPSQADVVDVPPKAVTVSPSCVGNGGGNAPLPSPAPSAAAGCASVTPLPTGGPVAPNFGLGVHGGPAAASPVCRRPGDRFTYRPGGAMANAQGMPLASQTGGGPTAPSTSEAEAAAALSMSLPLPQEGMFGMVDEGHCLGAVSAFHTDTLPQQPSAVSSEAAGGMGSFWTGAVLRVAAAEASSLLMRLATTPSSWTRVTVVLTTVLMEVVGGMSVLESVASKMKGAVIPPRRGSIPSSTVPPTPVRSVTVGSTTLPLPDPSPSPALSDFAPYAADFGNSAFEKAVADEVQRRVRAVLIGGLRAPQEVSLGVASLTTAALMLRCIIARDVVGADDGGDAVMTPVEATAAPLPSHQGSALYAAAQVSHRGSSTPPPPLPSPP